MFKSRWELMARNKELENELARFKLINTLLVDEKDSLTKRNRNLNDQKEKIKFLMEQMKESGVSILKVNLETRGSSFHPYIDSDLYLEKK